MRRRALEQALTLDPNLGEAHGRMAQLLWELGERHAAERHFERALELDPNNPFLLLRKASHFEWQGDLESSVAMSRKAISIDPLAVTYRYNLGTLLLYAGRVDEAAAEFDEVAALSPPQDLGFKYALLRIQQGRYREAMAMAVQLSLPADRYAIRAMAYRGLDQPRKAAAAIDKLEESDEPRAILHLAHILARSGDAEAPFEALDALERTGIENHSKLAEAQNAVSILIILRFAPFLRDAHPNERWTQRVYEIYERWRRAASDSAKQAG